MDRRGENHPEGAEYRNRRGPLNYLESELLRAGGKGGDREECVFSMAPFAKKQNSCNLNAV